MQGKEMTATTTTLYKAFVESQIALKAVKEQLEALCQKSRQETLNARWNTKGNVQDKSDYLAVWRGGRALLGVLQEARRFAGVASLVRSASSSNGPRSP